VVGDQALEPKNNEWPVKVMLMTFKGVIRVQPNENQINQSVQALKLKQ
jgi:hypothetical protein